MSQSLITLPYEVISNIINSLGFDDIVNLARTCRRVRYLIYEERICRRILETKIPCSKEAIGALSRGYGFSSAVRRVTKRRAAFSEALPYSAAIVGFGESFLYCNGVLCYVLDAEIRVLHLHDSGEEEAIISLRGFLQTFAPHYQETTKPRLEILHYNQNILCFLLEFSDVDTVSQSLLIAIDTEKGALLLKEELAVTEKIFVRHNEKCLFYGTHSERDIHGNKRWVIWGFQFDKQSWFEGSVHLSEMVGSDIGSTIDFEIYEPYFYALSNETSDEPEEVDWTSFYHCFRFPLDSPCKELLESTDNNCMWRRQHSEGPIDDRWTNLRLDCDEESNEIRIVEARREWHLGGSRSRRTYYITSVEFSKKGTAPCSDSDQLNPIQTNLSNLPNSQLLATLTSSDNPHYMEPPPRLPQNVHPGDNGYDRSAFVLNKTKVRFYHTSANTYMDLVDDPVVYDWQANQRLRIRCGSRKPCPFQENSDASCNPDATAKLDSESTTYRYSPIKMWPPNTPEFEELYALLNLPTHLGNVQGVADERSLVYCTGGKTNQPAAIVFINFDPGIKLSKLRKWLGPGIGEGPHIDGRATGGGETVSHERFDFQQGCKGKEKEIPQAEISIMDTTPTNPNKPSPMLDSLGHENGVASGFMARQTHTGRINWLRTEAAMYRKINRGFWFGKDAISQIVVS